MRSFGKIVLYLFFVLLGGALAAPKAWRLIHYLPTGMLHGLVGQVQSMPFHRYLTRSLQVTAIILLVPLLKSLRVRSLEELGLFANRYRFSDLIAGLAAGIPACLFLYAFNICSGAFEFHLNWTPSIVPKIILSAVVVACLEEFLFRGVILGFLRQFLNRWSAIVLSALIFAAVHFLNLPSPALPKEPPQWFSGLTALASIRQGLPPWPVFGWAFATLVIAGMILAWMTTRTGSLWASIGLHGILIASQQLFSSLAGFRRIPADAYLPLVGPAQCHGAVPTGGGVLFCLLLAGVIAWRLLKNRSSPETLSRGM